MPRAAGEAFTAWTKSVAEVEAHFGTSLAKGLTPAQVTAARARYGYNELDKEASKPLWKLVLEQFDDPLVKARAAAAPRTPRASPARRVTRRIGAHELRRGAPRSAAPCCMCCAGC